MAPSFQDQEPPENPVRFNVMAAVLVELERHDRHPGAGKGALSYATQLLSTSQPIRAPRCRYRLARDLLLPPLEVLRPIPAVAWIPLAILMFPSSELSMMFITFTGALFPILLNTVHGVEGVDPRLIASARSLGAGNRTILGEIILPGAGPNIVTGAAIGMGTAWFCLVTAEMISGQYGIGYFTWESYTDSG